MTVAFDANDTGSHTELVSQLVADHGPIPVAVVAFGILGDQQRAETDVAHALQIAHTDYVAQISVLTRSPRRCGRRVGHHHRVLVRRRYPGAAGELCVMAPPRPASTASPVASQMRCTAAVFGSC